MNLANRLTILRVLMLPPFIFFMSFRLFWLALIIFVLASVTDWLDGFIARKYNMITDFGKFLDPLADKVLVSSALICLVGFVPAWTVAVIIAREFIVTGFRLAVVSKDNTAVIAADIWGKIKTAFTMVAVCVILVMLSLWIDKHIIDARWVALISAFLMYICTALTVFSGFTMIWKNRKLFGE
ncbi:MAG: CDP-diacylglycerol--glycerol-3-phosphate 3-phosphatidyltransferase [Oscillospiraceae bacterium]|nr:CDP-diacylglycerol--glycerol-3-phosphate 3-phosphatidyltransferase [Oscillospiraceae bacterium]